MYPTSSSSSKPLPALHWPRKKVRTLSTWSGPKLPSQLNLPCRSPPVLSFSHTGLLSMPPLNHLASFFLWYEIEDWVKNSVKNSILIVRQIEVQILALSLTSCGNLGKLLHYTNLTVPQFLPLSSENSNTLWVNIRIEWNNIWTSLGQCLTEDKCSINGSYDMWTHTILSSWTLNPPTQVKLIILPSSVQAMILSCGFNHLFLHALAVLCLYLFYRIF